MATKINKEQLYELAVGALRDSLDWSDNMANARLLADEIAKYDTATANIDVVLKGLADKGILSRNEKLEAAFQGYFLRHPEFGGIIANREMLKKVFQYRQTGKYNNTPITVDALETQGKFLEEKNMLAKNQQAIETERETQRVIAEATRESQERVRLIAELLSVWKISKNPYSSAPGEITQKVYDQKESDLYALPMDELRQKHAVIMEKRAMRSISPAELKLKVRANAEQYKVGSQTVERYLPLPKQMVFSPEIHPRVISGDLLRWMAEHQIERYKLFIERYGSNQLSDRIDGKDGI
jgi:hypothetical protein